MFEIADYFDFVDVDIIDYYFELHFEKEILAEFFHILADCMDTDHQEVGLAVHLMEVDLVDYNIVVYLADFAGYHMEKILEVDLVVDYFVVHKVVDFVDYIVVAVHMVIDFFGYMVVVVHKVVDFADYTAVVAVHKMEDYMFVVCYMAVGHKVVVHKVEDYGIVAYYIVVAHKEEEDYIVADHTEEDYMVAVHKVIVHKVVVHKVVDHEEVVHMVVDHMIAFHMVIDYTDHIVDSQIDYTSLYYFFN